MRGVGLCLVVTATAASATAAEPSTPAFPYAVITLSNGLTGPGLHTAVRAALPTTPPLRLWLGAPDAGENEGTEPRTRAIRLTLEPEATASFPIESDAPVCQATASPRGRWLTLRKDLEDGGGCQALDAPSRLIRRAMEESGDPASLSARVLRTTLD